ncbi:Tox-REase-5 domain-containing protein [Massilia sp. W12]|uniref:Tox-REase-5 domain-containing protein n=1 Tax=Massilia sp. W12 TaxID=3126507 RepID=UPI0030D2A436
MIGQSQGGPGVWQAAPLRAKGVEYQELVTGVERGVEYAVEHPGVPSGKVLFDGYDPVRKVLIDAKDWRKYPPLEEIFWHANVVADAQKQLIAAGKTKVEWLFSTKEAKDAVEELLASNGLDSITCIFMKN